MTARDFVEAAGGAVLRRMGRTASRFQEESPLPVDVLESEDEYLVVFDAPGATTSDVQVNYSGRTVRVRVDRFREHHEGFEMRFPGRGLSMDGSATLPADAVVDPDHARAELHEDGTLYVFLPKGERDAEEGRFIDVEPGEPADEAGSVDDESADDESGE